MLDKVHRYRLSREGKNKADKKRQSVEENFLKTTHLQRQEAAQVLIFFDKIQLKFLNLRRVVKKKLVKENSAFWRKKILRNKSDLKKSNKNERLNYDNPK